MSEPPFAVVIGACGGIGEAIALGLATGGSRVALVDRDDRRMDAVRGRLPPDTLAFVADASRRAAVDEILAHVREHGPVQQLAVAVGATLGGSVDGLSDELWHATIDSNLTAVFQTIRATLAGHPAGGPLAICVVGSVHAAEPRPGYPAYAAAKAGVAALVKQVAVEYGHLGVRINLVTPGWTRVAHTSDRLDDESSLLDATPLREFAEPDDVAGAVTFLLGPSARRVTGAELVVDGGAFLLSGESALRSEYRRRLGLI